MTNTEQTKVQKTAFSFEVLPPKKGEGIEGLEKTIECLLKYNPRYINITTHHSEPVYNRRPDGLIEVEQVRKRPGTVAVAAALQYKYKIPVVPHILCQGFTREETEYVLLDLQFLGIDHLLLLRGDRTKENESLFPAEKGNQHTTELQEQVNRFNDGYFLNGSLRKTIGAPFSYGVACYPEKHSEAPNMETDIHWLKVKADNGANYAVTQMFFDNNAYFSFVEKIRAAGINIPIIPGIKPLVSKRQLTLLPSTFQCSIPLEFSTAMMKATNETEEFQIGVEWCIKQCQELINHGVPSLHFYTTGKPSSVDAVASKLFL